MLLHTTPIPPPLARPSPCMEAGAQAGATHQGAGDHLAVGDPRGALGSAGEGACWERDLKGAEGRHLGKWDPDNGLCKGPEARPGSSRNSEKASKAGAQ